MQRKNLIVGWSEDIHWRNLYGSGLLNELAAKFGKIVVIGPRQPLHEELPENVEFLVSRSLLMDPWLNRIIRVINIHFFLRYKRLNKYRREFYKKEKSLDYYLAFSIGYLAQLLFLLGCTLRTLIALPKLIPIKNPVILTHSFIWDGQDSILGMYAWLFRKPWYTLITSWDNPSTKGRFKIVPKRVFVWGSLNSREVNFFQEIPLACIHTLTPPHFARMHAVINKTYPTFRAVVYIGVTHGNYPYEEAFVSKLIDIMREMDILTRHGLVIRPHPNDSSPWVKRFSNIEGVVIDSASLRRTSARTVFSTNQESLDEYYKLLRNASVTISYYSTATVESGLLGVPSILTRITDPEDLRVEYSADKIEHFNDLRESPGSLIVSNSQELKNALALCIAGLPKETLLEHFKICERVAKFPQEDLFEKYSEILLSDFPNGRNEALSR